LLLGEQKSVPQININDNVENNKDSEYGRLSRQIIFPQGNKKEKNLLLVMPTKQAQIKLTLNRLIGKGGYGEVYYGK